MSVSHVDAVVVRLLGAHNGGEAVSAAFVGAHPLSIAEGLEAQAQVQEALGPVGAWKVSSSSTKEKPNFAPILSKRIYGESARFAAGTFRSIGIECEIAYRMARDLLDPPYTPGAGGRRHRGPRSAGRGLRQPARRFQGGAACLALGRRRQKRRYLDRRHGRRLGARSTRTGSR
ncbi:MAG: hypothetical protein WDN48_15815 [Pseudolabrys sp.]